MSRKLLRLAAEECGSMNSPRVTIGRFNVKYILKLVLIAVVPALLIVGTASAAQQHHHHKAGHRAHHRSAHHSHSATRHKNPNWWSLVLGGARLVAQDTEILRTWGAAMLRPYVFVVTFSWEVTDAADVWDPSLRAGWPVGGIGIVVKSENGEPVAPRFYFAVSSRKRRET
jgi:hypothetical protein